MAENAPPASSAQNANSDASRGMPYYEKLRRDLRETLANKRALDLAMAGMEENIYKMETHYLEETTAGNIIKGFDNYIKGSTSATAGTGAGTSSRRKATISDADRIFSRSSSNFLRESEPPNSATTTPSHAATPTSSFPSKDTSMAPNGTGPKGTNSKKKKAPEKDEEEEGKPAKRGKITYARE